MKTKKYKKEQYDQQIKRDEYIGQPMTYLQITITKLGQMTF